MIGTPCFKIVSPEKYWLCTLENLYMSSKVYETKTQQKLSNNDRDFYISP